MLSAYVQCLHEHIFALSLTVNALTIEKQALNPFPLGISASPGYDETNADGPLEEPLGKFSVLVHHTFEVYIEPFEG